MSIDVISLENFSALPPTEIKSSTKSCRLHAVFHYYFSDDSNQYAATTTAHRIFFIELLKEQKVLTSKLSKIWGNTDGCADQYRCASALYLMSVLSQCYSIIIDRGIIAPGHGKEVVNVINAIYKSYIYQLMSNFQLPGSKKI